MVERTLGKTLVVHQWIYEKTDGRVGASLAGRPMLLLRTVGRRTGEPRTSALLYVHDGDVYAVIGSLGGAPKNPGWFHNLVNDPDVEIQVGRERIPVHARIAADEERTRLWSLANGVNKGQYDAYQARTVATSPWWCWSPADAAMPGVRTDRR